MIPVLLAAGVAAAIATWAHLRPHGAQAAQPFPSLQHVPGIAARRRRIFPLEERFAWLLRLAALALAVLGVWRARNAPLDPVIVIDPGASESGPLPQGLVLRFDGETPVAEGPGAAEAFHDLRNCSDSQAGCLVRAAARTGRPIVIAGTFGEHWQAPLVESKRPFEYLRWRENPRDGRTHDHAGLKRRPRTGNSDAALLWRAALPYAQVDIVDDGSAWNGAIVACDRGGPATPVHPAIVERAPSTLILDDPLELVAGTPAFVLGSRLRFDTRDALLGGLAVRLPDRNVAVAATPEELARWAHAGILEPLARTLVALRDPEIEARNVPVGDTREWRDATGAAGGLGVVDVAPGTWRRADGKVTVELGRSALDLSVGALDNAALAKLHGKPWVAPAEHRDVGSALLVAALALWLVALFPLRLQALLPQVALGAALAVLIWNPTRFHATRPGRAARAEGAIAAAAAHKGVPLCSKECQPFATGALATEPVDGADALVFDPRRPRVDLLEVRLPDGPLSLGTAAELRAVVRVRRAAGKKVTAVANAPSAPGASMSFVPASDDDVRDVSLAVAPIVPGNVFVAVEARVEGEAGSEDGRLVMLSMRGEPARRLVLAAEPSWDARVASEALEALGTAGQTTSVGATAVISRGAPHKDPFAILSGDLTNVDTLVLFGFNGKGRSEKSMQALRAFLERGGAAIVFGALPKPSPFGFEELAVQTSVIEAVTGTVGDRKFMFSGYLPYHVSLPPGTQVLARLGGRDSSKNWFWIGGHDVGRGRLVVVAAPDLWRVSPPAGRDEPYRSVLAAALAWAESPNGGRTRLDPGWDVIREGKAATFVAEQAEVAPAKLSTVPRAKLRAAAYRNHHPFLEIDGVEALAAAWARVPPPEPRREPLKLRSDDIAFAALAALFAVEALARRLRA